jgi:uncharacterized protein (TIGR02265 family)
VTRPGTPPPLHDWRTASYELGPGTALTGDFDYEAIARDIPGDRKIKGMFFARQVATLGAQGTHELMTRLDSAPRLGRFVPFSDYPASDYVRLLGAAARSKHPNLPAREAVRRLARGDVDQFASSTVGAVIVALVRDAREALLRVPDAYKAVLRNQSATATRLPDGSVRLEMPGFAGLSEYILGQIEGIVTRWGAQPFVRGEYQAFECLRFDVRCD